MSATTQPIEVSYYTSSRSNKGRVMRLEDFHHKVRSGLWKPQITRCREILANGDWSKESWKAYREYRNERVTHIAAHGIMPDKAAAIPIEQRITRFIGLAQIDYDKLTPEQFDSMRAVAVADPHVSWAGRSPSGVGLKILLRAPVAQSMAEWHVISASAERYAFHTFGMPCEHGSVAEATKLLCATYDPEAHYNPQAEPIEASAPEGTRHDTIKRIVASAVTRGLDDAAIHAEVRSQIPDEDKDDKEIDDIIRWTRAKEAQKDDPAKPSAGATKDEKGKPAPSLREIMLSRLYDPNTPVPEPDYRLWIKGVPIMSAGNVSTLVSLPKLGKSSVIVAAIAAGCGEGEYLGLRGENKDGRPIVHLDTEQSKYHHDQKLRTISKRLGVERLPDHVVSFRLTGERLGIENVREAVRIAMERNEGKKPYAVLLDGGVDFLLDPNDPDASFAMVKDLMAVADEFDCIVLVSIHYNPSQPGTASKSRGHYGSELERKSEAYLTISKDPESGNRSLFTKFARERELPEGEAVRFAWDEQAGMFNVLTDQATGYNVDNVLKILDREGATERAQLKKLLKHNYGGDPRTWEGRIIKAHKDRLVTTSGRPAKVCLTANGKCRLETMVEREEDGLDDEPF
jgi:hypothetical protein